MINALYLRHVSWKSRMDMLVEKLSPPLGVPGNCQKTTAPDAPASLFPDPNRAQIKDCIDNKTVEKKGSQLLPEERIIDDARGWAGRLGVHSKNQLHLVRVGWLAMESVHLTCPCCSEDVVLRYVSGYWLNLSSKNSEHIPDQGRNPRAPIAGTETC